MTLKIAILLFVAINLAISQELLLCLYEDINGTYTCNILILNQNENYNFSNIDGTHLPSFGDDNVLAVTTSTIASAVTIPSIICDKFQNVETLSYISMGLRIIYSYTFTGCSKVTSINLSSNNITELPDGIFNSQQSLKELTLSGNQIHNLKPEWFESLKNLEKLTLRANSIKELPSRVFSSLINLKGIFLEDNKLQVIHSDSFWLLPKLEVMNFKDNQIDAIDERILDLTGVNILVMMGNNCSSEMKIDNTTGRQEMRTFFRNCFEKYEALFLACKVGDLDERVCTLEAEQRGFLLKTEILAREKQELEEKFNDQVIVFNEAITDLQNQINKLKNPSTAAEETTSSLTTSTEGTPRYTTKPSAATTFTNGQNIFYVSYFIVLLIISNYFIN